ncbi:MAG: transposase domain-containing protein [Schleiferiaceae bacterium]|nr:transposase domain-containing protein [Schleiferiaceae bacterium]MDR9441485.1 transposase domain-containing protein [Schleiferiaceae bacterium]
MVYYLFASCKANGLYSYSWLKEVLEVIPDHKANGLQELLHSSPRFKQKS